MYKFILTIFLLSAVAAGAQQDTSLSSYPPQDTARANFMLHVIRRNLKRTQIPHTPYNYTVEDCSFTNKVTGLTYGATLTKPLGLKSFPTAVLMTGTSPQDRDYTCDSHKYFWVLADYLSNHGIAVLRMDDRGVNGTTGIYKQSTSLDFAKDMIAGVTFLNSRNDIDHQRIGLIGHSEGGIIVPMAYHIAPSKIHFTVLISAPIIGLRAINHYQSEQEFKKGWRNDTIAAARMRLHEFIVSHIPQEAHTAAELHTVLANAVDTFYKTENPKILAKLRIKNDEGTIYSLNRAYKGFLSPWWQYILTYDPVTDIRKINCPVLAFFGDKDQQVPPIEDYNLLKANLPVNKLSVVTMIPDMNHFMQPDTIGNPDNYEKIETSIKPILLDQLTKWVNSLPKKPSF